MDLAHKRDSLLKDKFWFNKNFIQAEKYWECNLTKTEFKESKTRPEDRIEPEFEQFFVHEILCGKKGTDFKGIYPVLRKFMEYKNYDNESVEHINYMFDFLCARARGDVPTGARFIRDLVDMAPTYNHDSIISLCTITLLTQEIIRLNHPQNDE